MVDRVSIYGIAAPPPLGSVISVLPHDLLDHRFDLLMTRNDFESRANFELSESVQGEYLTIFFDNGEQIVRKFFIGFYKLNRYQAVVAIVIRGRGEQARIEPSFPEGAECSKILSNSMVMQLVSVFPARAQGYSWVKCYDSLKNGSLLSTLYRNIKTEFGQEVSPLLIIIRNSKGAIFGAVTSEPFCPWWKFQGTGGCFLWIFSQSDSDSCPVLQQYSWTGKNDYFLLTSHVSLGACEDHRRKEIYNPEQPKHDTEMDTNDTDSFDEEDISKQEVLNSSDLNRSLDALNELWLKTQQAKKEAKRIPWAVHPTVSECHENPSYQVPNCEDDNSQQYYLCLRLRKNKTTSGSSPNTSSMSIEDNLPFGNKDRREFWFTLPSNTAEKIYYFLLQWLPDKYGMDTTTSSFDETESSMLLDPMSREKSFVVLDSASEESLYSDSNSFSANSGKEWEFVAISELWRRIRPDKLVGIEPSFPEGAECSKILSNSMVMQLVSVFPARAQGYSWVKCYDSLKNGSLLSTLYRNIKTEFGQEVSPLLIIIRNSKGAIFGAVTSEPFCPWWKFQGTGGCFLWIFSQSDSDSCPMLQQYPWTGKNDYFLLASHVSFCMGASEGHYGLYLDADLLHGRTEQCATYGNEILTGAGKDFTVDAVEVFGFRL